MNLGMQLTPMLTLGLCCTECGQLLNKHPRQATDTEIIAEGVGCGAVNPDNVRREVCPKCGQTKLSETVTK